MVSDQYLFESYAFNILCAVDIFDGDNTQARMPGTRPPTKKQLARLGVFAPEVRPLVKLMADRIKLRAITECAYADVLSPDDLPPEARPQKPQTTSTSIQGTIRVEVLLDEWLIEEWAIVNSLLRPGATPMPLKWEYCQYACSSTRCCDMLY